MSWQKIIKISENLTLYAAINDRGGIEIATDEDALINMGWKLDYNRWNLRDIIDWTEEQLRENDSERRNG